MSELFKKVADGWPVIAAAPWTFAAIMFTFIAVAVPVIWKALSWSYQARLDGFQARLGSKDEQIASLQRQRDEYKDKLSGASPDEAKARIEELERRARRASAKNALGRFIEAGTEIMRQALDADVRDDAEQWVSRTHGLIGAAFGSGEASLFLNDSGYTFFGGGTNSDVRNFVDGRLRRLGELMRRADSMNVALGFDPQPWTRG